MFCHVLCADICKCTGKFAMTITSGYCFDIILMTRIDYIHLAHNHLRHGLRSILHITSLTTISHQ